MKYNLEQQKEERLKKFLKEFPDWEKKMYDDAYFEAQKRKELKRAGRIQRFAEICELKYKNNMTLMEIGEKYNVTKQRIQQILKGIGLM